MSRWIWTDPEKPVPGVPSPIPIDQKNTHLYRHFHPFCSVAYNHICNCLENSDKPWSLHRGLSDTHQCLNNVAVRDGNCILSSYKYIHKSRQCFCRYFHHHKFPNFLCIHWCLQKQKQSSMQTPSWGLCLLFLTSGGSMGGTSTPTPPPLPYSPPLFWVEKEEMTERWKAGRASKTEPGPPLPQGVNPPLLAPRHS